MLGPASFINHSCQPNAEYQCGGETRGQTVVRIVTTKPIEAGEEIFVKYGENYFGEGNKDCRCEHCLEKVYAPPPPNDNARNDSNDTQPPPESVAVNTVIARGKIN